MKLNLCYDQYNLSSTITVPLTIKEILSSMESQLSLPPSSYTVIDEIAQKLQLSVGYINLIFKKNKKQTLFSYTVNKRIEKSKELLKDDSLSISKISRMVGYSSNAYFATAFKKTVGVTPMQYRNRILGIN